MMQHVELTSGMAFLCLTGLTQKSIERLFPVDNSMVVIIDDRSDVWSSARNLIKVVPCTYLPFPHTLLSPLVLTRTALALRRRVFCRNGRHQRRFSS